MKYWSKSALLMYRYLEKMTNSIDKLIMDTSKHSNSQSAQRNHTTYFQARKLIELLDRKRKMINLKVAVEDALAQLDKTDRRILSLAFLDGVTSDLIAQFLGVSLRTYFRKKVRALDNFSIQMMACGFDTEFFRSEYYSEKWFMSVYNECLSKSSKDEEIVDNVLIKRVMTELSQVKLTASPYYS